MDKRMLGVVAVAAAVLGGCAGLPENGRIAVGDRTIIWDRLCGKAPEACQPEEGEDDRR